MCDEVRQTDKTILLDQHEKLLKELKDYIKKEHPTIRTTNPREIINHSMYPVMLEREPILKEIDRKLKLNMKYMKNVSDVYKNGTTIPTRMEAGKTLVKNRKKIIDSAKNVKASRVGELLEKKVVRVKEKLAKRVATLNKNKKPQKLKQIARSLADTNVGRNI